MGTLRDAREPVRHRRQRIEQCRIRFRAGHAGAVQRALPVRHAARDRVRGIGETEARGGAAGPDPAHRERVLRPAERARKTAVGRRRGKRAHPARKRYATHGAARDEDDRRYGGDRGAPQPRAIRRSPRANRRRRTPCALRDTARFDDRFLALAAARDARVVAAHSFGRIRTAGQPRVPAGVSRRPGRAARREARQRRALADRRPVRVLFARAQPEPARLTDRPTSIRARSACR